MKRLILILFSFLSLLSFAVEPPFSSSADAFCNMQMPDGISTSIVFSASDSTDHFCNGAVLTSFRGRLYCQWQTSRSDEDSPDTRVVYATSDDSSRTWSEPVVLADSLPIGFYTSGGWFARNDSLIAYLNFWPRILTPKGGYTCYRSSADGSSWSAVKPVLMADGSQMNGIFEQDPHLLPGGRIICAAHFQPGLHVAPVFSDDSSGVRGWQKADFISTEGESGSSVEIEPSLFLKSDSDVIMVFRDQSSSFRKLASVSHDNGISWTKAVRTDFPDARTKQSAGNLPDGTAFFVCSPVSSKFRCPLAVSLSADGRYFTKTYILRSESQLPPLRFQGMAKRPGYHYPKSLVCGGILFIAYSVNKETIAVTSVPVSSLSVK